MIHPQRFTELGAARNLFVFSPCNRFTLFLSSTRSFSTMSNQRNCQQVQKCKDLEDIFKQKKVLRLKVRKALREMDPALRSQEDDAIQRNVLGTPWFQSSQRLCAYISCSSLKEVDTSKVLSQILQNPDEDGRNQFGKKLYVPRVEDKRSHMRMLHIASTNDLVANAMNILEPGPMDSFQKEHEDVMQANEPVDLLLLPGLAFDRSGRRLGRGGGLVYPPFLA